MGTPKEFFTITINDSFCTWQYKISPENINNLAISDIMEVLENHFKTEAFDRECVSDPLLKKLEDIYDRVDNSEDKFNEVTELLKMYLQDF